MTHTTEMVKEYASQQAFAADEQVLGQQGWPVAATVHPSQQQSWIKSIFGRAARDQERVVVTYSRAAPS